MSPKPKEDVPTTALKCRELREKLGLTQEQMAAELGMHPVAYRRYEGGAREPSTEKYMALAEAAKQRGLSSLEEFFRSQPDKKQAERKERTEDARALFELEEAEARAREESESEDSVKREAAQEAKRFLELSKIDKVEYAKQKVMEIIRASQTLSNGEVAAKVYDISQETYYVDLLRRGRQVRAGRALSAMQRQIAELPAFDSALAEAEKRMEEIEKLKKEKIKSILDESEKLVGQGYQVWKDELLSKLQLASDEAIRGREKEWRDYQQRVKPTLELQKRAIEARKAEIEILAQTSGFEAVKMFDQMFRNPEGAAAAILNALRDPKVIAEKQELDTEETKLKEREAKLKEDEAKLKEQGEAVRPEGHDSGAKTKQEGEDGK